MSQIIDRVLMSGLLLGAVAAALSGQSSTCQHDAVIQCNAQCSDIGECIFGCEIGGIGNSDVCAESCSTLGDTCLNSCLKVINQIANCPYVTGDITVSCGTLVYNRAAQVWQQTVRITNTSTTTTMNYVGYVLDSLVAGWTLTNGDGVTSALAPVGSPYKNLAPPASSAPPLSPAGLNSGSLAPGAVATLTMTFTRTGTTSFGYIPRVVTSVSR